MLPEEGCVSPCLGEPPARHRQGTRKVREEKLGVIGVQAVKSTPDLLELSFSSHHPVCHTDPLDPLQHLLQGVLAALWNQRAPEPSSRRQPTVTATHVKYGDNFV